MVSRMYRVCEPLRGVYASGEKGILLIPKDATIAIRSPPDENQFVAVIWQEATLQVFTKDFQERTEPLPVRRGVGIPKCSN
jgi:hypothetical protein